MANQGNEGKRGNLCTNDNKGNFSNKVTWVTKVT